MNNWEFKYLGYIKYLCANLPTEFFCISFIEKQFFLFVFLYLFFFYFVILPVMDFLLFQWMIVVAG